MPHITQKDIAKELGVTRITVSKALSQSSDISFEMRKKVQQLASARGYVPNHAAWNLHRKKTNTIGVVVPDVSNSFFSFAIHGIMDMATKHGYHVMLTVSRENPDIEKENILTLLSHRVDGLLVAVSKDTKDTTVFETVKKMNIPLVFFDRTIEEIGFSSISINDRKASADLVEYAIGCGYRNIAHLGGSSTIALGRDRRAGYEEALKRHNIPVREAWIVEGGFDKASGYNGFHALQQQAELPEIVFAANDRIAQGAFKAIKEAGLRIPEDIGVIALGHNEFAENLSPSLTIMDAPPDVIGQRAMEILVEEMKDPSKCGQHHIVLETSMKIHGSIGNKSNIVK